MLETIIGLLVIIIIMLWESKSYLAKHIEDVYRGILSQSRTVSKDFDINEQMLETLKKDIEEIQHNVNEVIGKIDKG